MTDILQMSSYSDGDVDTNTSVQPSLESLASDRYSRRQTMFGGISATAMAVFGTTMLSACGGDDEVDQGPIVTPGAVAATSAGRVVTLTATTAPDVISGSWKQTGGATVTLTSVDKTTATFIAPAVSAMQDLTFAYSVTTHRGVDATGTSTVRVNPAVLGFAAVPKNRNDVVTVPAGYSVTVLTRLGDPLAAGVSAYANNGTDGDFARRVGDHGDALYWYGLSAAGARDDNSNTRGLMVQNHENISEQYLHPAGPTNISAGPRPEAEAIKEIEAHGVSIAEYRDAGGRKWSYAADSQFNHRITPSTPVVFNGPARGSDFFKTAYSPDGTQGRGTLNNCGNGPMAWGTNLTCEENWAGYFRRSGDDAARTPRELTALRRYGVTGAIGNFAWSTVASTNSVFRRWDARASTSPATSDYRNEPNTFGWTMELDPYDKTQAPRKRTALGRFAKEGAWLSRLAAGKKIAIYMGDDARREYFYKFVSAANWDPADANATNRLAIGDKYLDAGTLYVAKFNADGTGQWLPLVFGQVPDRAASGTDARYVFANQADILVNTRLAADPVGATPMDRPEWTAVNSQTGEVYLTLTNNNAALRPLNGTDAANPRHYNDPKAGVAQLGNPNGHIIRIRENGDETAALAFSWDIYLFGADSAQADPTNVNLSGLNASNDFSSPDGIWFSRPQNAAGLVKPVLWVQTDDGAFTDVTNNQMLAAMPGSVGDGTNRTITNRDAGGATATQATRVGAVATDATLRRFLVGPLECEITGVDTTPDGRTLFVGVQHPGESGTTGAPSSHWPDSQASGSAAASVRPRSAIVAITKDDGGVVAL